MQTPDQPLVADGYGDAELAISEPAGGLSAAATDVAQLVAILLDTRDNPALKRGTLEQMLSQAAVFAAPYGRTRAGFGLDGPSGRALASTTGRRAGWSATRQPCSSSTDKTEDGDSSRCSAAAPAAQTTWSTPIGPT